MVGSGMTEDIAHSAQVQAAYRAQRFFHSDISQVENVEHAYGVYIVTLVLRKAVKPARYWQIYEACLCGNAIVLEMKVQEKK